jgi:hypothetical protein
MIDTILALFYTIREGSALWAPKKEKINIRVPSRPFADSAKIVDREARGASGSLAPRA